MCCQRQDISVNFLTFCILCIILMSIRSAAADREQFFSGFPTKKRGCEDFTCFRQHKTNIPLTGNIPVVSRLQKQIISSFLLLFFEICIHYMPGLSVCQTLFRHIFLFFPPHRLVNKRNILYNGFDFYMEKIHSEGPSAERLKMDRESGSLCFHACAISGCAFATVFWWPATAEKCILTVKGGN